MEWTDDREEWRNGGSQTTNDERSQKSKSKVKKSTANANKRTDERTEERTERTNERTSLQCTEVRLFVPGKAVSPPRPLKIFSRLRNSNDQCSHDRNITTHLNMIFYFYFRGSSLLRRQTIDRRRQRRHFEQHNADANNETASTLHATRGVDTRGGRVWTEGQRDSAVRAISRSRK